MSDRSATQVAAQEIAFGSLSGIAGKIVEYPFDTIKVRLQSQPSTGQPHYTSTLDCIRQTLKHDGYSGFYRGISAPLAGAMFENAVLFVSYSKATLVVKRMLDIGEGTDLDTGGIMLSGAMSGAVTSFVLTPVELIKCRLQVQTAFLQPASLSSGAMESKRGAVGSMAQRNVHSLAPSRRPAQTTITQLVAEIYKTKGLLGFWRGQFSTLIRESGGSCCWFSIYELSLRAFRAPGSPKSENTQTQLMVSGALAGVGYNTLFFPFDTIKSRMQTNASQSGFTQVVREVWQRHGMRGYFKGWGITVARAAPSNALIFWVYESLSRRYM